MAFARKKSRETNEQSEIVSARLYDDCEEILGFRPDCGGRGYLARRLAGQYMDGFRHSAEFRRFGEAERGKVWFFVGEFALLQAWGIINQRYPDYRANGTRNPGFMPLPACPVFQRIAWRDQVRDAIAAEAVHVVLTPEILEALGVQTAPLALESFPDAF